jgi:predicted secreted protein
MQGKWFVLGFLLLLSILFLGGCVQAAPVEPQLATQSIELREGETYTLALEMDPAADRQWQVVFDETLLELAERTADEAAGQERFTFRALATGTTEAYFSYRRPNEVICTFNIGADPALAETMSETEAREIAANGVCGQAGALKENAFYNDWTATWWIDLDAQKEGCAPACVVDVRTGQAEINWRCTGALPPQK